MFARKGRHPFRKAVSIPLRASRRTKKKSKRAQTQKEKNQPTSYRRDIVVRPHVGHGDFLNSLNVGWKYRAGEKVGRS